MDSFNNSYPVIDLLKTGESLCNPRVIPSRYIEPRTRTFVLHQDGLWRDYFGDIYQSSGLRLTNHHSATFVYFGVYADIYGRNSANVGNGNVSIYSYLTALRGNLFDIYRVKFEPRPILSEVGVASGFSSIQRGQSRLAGFYQRLSDKVDANDRSDDGENCRYDRKEGPLCHVPLGLKVLFGTPLLAAGIALCFWGYRRGDRSVGLREIS